MMKFLFLPLLAALLCSSCRTMIPLDPMTMKPCRHCLPGNFNHNGEECSGCGSVEATK